MTSYDWKLLNKLYNMLPDISPQYITMTLTSSGTRNNKTSSAVRETIDRIRMQEEHAGRMKGEKIDFEYFKKLYQLSINCEDREKWIKTRYSISPQDQELLSDVYRLLLGKVRPQYVTMILHSNRIHNNNRTYQAIEDAISQISMREKQAGNSEWQKLDFSYFRKLHWASIRVFGHGGYTRLQVGRGPIN